MRWLFLQRSDVAKLLKYHFPQPKCKESPECWDVFLQRVVSLYCTLVKQTTPVSCGALGRHWFASAKSKIATVFGPEVSTLRDRDGSFFNNLMHPADGGDLAFVPREHPVKLMWTTSGGRTRLLPTTSARVPPSRKLWVTFFADRLDPLCADFLALDVVEMDAYILHPQRTLAALKFFQQCLRDNGSIRAC